MGTYEIRAGNSWLGSYYPDTDEITLDIWDDNLEEIVLKAIQRKFPRSEATVAMMGRDFS
jgi:hypothetical protein